MKAAVLLREVGKDMLSRLEWMSLKPRIILDAGCAVGEMSLALQARYPHACVLGLETDFSMLDYAKHHMVSPGIQLVNATMDQFPLRDQSVDLIFANLLFPFLNDIKLILREWRRVLTPNGLLMISALGLDSLQACSAANQLLLMDMHDVGDLLLSEGFAEPVLDVDHYTMTYRDKNKLINELYQSKMIDAAINLENAEIVAVNDKWQMHYEIIHAHAFAPAQTNEISASAEGVVRVPLSHLRKQLK